MRPHPIWPMFILLLGAFFPKTDEGTMVGKLFKAIDPAVTLIVFFRKRLLLFESSKFFMVKYWVENKIHANIKVRMYQYV
jgi:hypothetical protein